MLEAIEYIQNEMENKPIHFLENDKNLYWAMVKNVEIIGEAANHFSEELKARYPHIQWRKIKGMRNHFVHKYFDININILYQTIEEDIPYLHNTFKGK